MRSGGCGPRRSRGDRGLLPEEGFRKPRRSAGLLPAPHGATFNTAGTPRSWSPGGGCLSQSPRSLTRGAFRQATQLPVWVPSLANENSDRASPGTVPRVERDLAQERRPVLHPRAHPGTHGYSKNVACSDGSVTRASARGQLGQARDASSPRARVTTMGAGSFTRRPPGRRRALPCGHPEGAEATW